MTKGTQKSFGLKKLFSDKANKKIIFGEHFYIKLNLHFGYLRKITNF
jgi:hypothetical protein